jgi:PAS domain S-box-containing protein
LRQLSWLRANDSVMKCLRLFANDGVSGGFKMSGIPTYEELEQRLSEVEKKLATNKRAEDALRESEEKYRKIFENVQDVFFQTDYTGNIIEISPSIKRYTGFTREALIGTSVLKLYHNPKDREKLLKTLLKTGEVIDYELRLKSKNNRSIYGSINAHIFYDSEGKPIGGEGSVRDINDRKLVEEKLRASEERYRSLVDNIAIGVALISPDMEILTLNNQMKKWFPHIDTSKRPLCYRSYNDPPFEGVCSYCPTIKTLQNGEVHEAVTNTPMGGHIIHYRVLSSPIKNHKGKVIAAIEMVEDITERKRAEEHIQNLSQKILNAQEEERQMISRELHDSVAQDLSTLKIALEMFDKQSILSLETTQKLSEFSKILDRSISTVRNLSYDLRPPGLKEFGLLQTLSTYCEEFAENTGINVAFHPAGLKKAMTDFFSEINLYRLVQEGLNNVRKHAEADQVIVKLVGAYPDIILRIEDNGKGFDMRAREHASTSERRMGLRSMKERVKLLQGQMSVQSHPGKGTKILIKFPFKEDNNDSEKTNYHH